MTQQPFDSYADSYGDLVAKSIAFTGGRHAQYTERKARLLLDVIARNIGDPAHVRALDVGCGIGLTDEYIAPHVGELHGIDTAPRAIEQAAKANPEVRYESYPGDRLPYANGSFDVAFAICVLHHVAPAARARFADDLARVVRPGGLVAFFEHNPFNPLTRIAVNRCEFDRDAIMLTRRHSMRILRAAGLDLVEQRYVIFLPFARQWTSPVERGFSWLPFGAQYYTVGRRP